MRPLSPLQRLTLEKVAGKRTGRRDGRSVRSLLNRGLMNGPYLTTAGRRALDGRRK